MYIFINNKDNYVYFSKHLGVSQEKCWDGPAFFSVLLGHFFGDSDLKTPKNGCCPSCPRKIY